MKKYHARILYIAIATWVPAAGAAEQLAIGVPEVIERGPHHRKWAHFTSSTNANGQITVRTNRYTEISTGLHYRQNGEWLESREVIDIVAGGAMASQGPHQVGFAANINTLGAINMLTPDGQRLRSHVLGLAYTDAATGQSVLLAHVKDSIGMLVADNQIIYPDAFDNANAVQADIRYTYSRAGLEQDIILRADPPGPELFGLDPATTRLEVFTEFIEAPEPTVVESSILDRSPPERRNNMILPDFVNQTLGFGNMRMEAGAAFPVENETEPEKGLPTGKTWEVLQGRNLLIESVQYPVAKPHLAKLPPNPRVARAVPQAGPNRIFPPPPVQARQENKITRMAGLHGTKGGFVIDYTLVNSGMTNFVFQADTTYLVKASGITSLYGTPVLEGGTVIKYTNGTSTLIRLRFLSNVDCRTSPYHPAIFTSMHDDTIGDVIAGSTGNPTNYAGGMIELSSGSGTPTFDFHDVRVRHGYYAFLVNSGARLNLSHAQLSHNRTAVRNNLNLINLRNVLIFGSQHAFDNVSTATNNAEHVTFHSISNFLASGTVSVHLTNSLLIGVTNNVYYDGTGVETNLSDSGIFQTVGAGAHYLAAGSAYRTAGITNINAALRSDLQRRTTFPPVVLAQTNITSALTLGPSASVQRDTNATDLGYHYDPIDYAVSSVLVTNANLQIDPGTTIAVFNPTNAGRSGLSFTYNAGFQAIGWADSKVTITHYSTVQEMANTNWNGSINAFLYMEDFLSGSPELRCRFTDFTALGNSMSMLDCRNTNMFWRLTDCQFHGGGVYNYGGSSYFTNCLLNRSLTRNEPNVDAEHYFDNCTVYGGGYVAVPLFPLTGANFHIRDSLFVNAELITYPDVGNTNIGYLGSYRLTPTNSTDVILTDLSFQTGPQGNFYVSTNSGLANLGSRNATSAGLYHYTMLTNNVKETNTIVDIGFHYVATEINGTPPDSDGDGVSDYLEDGDGNGSFGGPDATDWKIYNTLFGVGAGPALEVFTPLKPK